jgi:mono/diheme cytochrome c family protein
MRRLLLLLILIAGCRKPDQFRSPMILGGHEVSADVLNLGHRTYLQHCASCHGPTGAGDGPLSKGMNPPPTDLRRGLYQFASVEAGGLPTDTDLQRTIRKGLQGTAMAPTPLGTDEQNAVVQFIKTLSPRWLQEPASPVVRADPLFAPASARQQMHSQEEWIEKGRRLYHIEAKCWSCHPAYVPKQALYEESGRTISFFRADLYEAKPSVNSFGVRTVAPDFLKDTLKTGNSDEALYRVIACGIGGTGMGSTRLTLDEEQLWSVVAYVKSLTEMKTSGKAQELRSRLEAQMDWQPGK